ncbi:MAG: hypothetical protein ACKOEZ_01505 [Spartobacteria bacterium]
MAPQILTDADYEHISRIIYQHSRIHLGDGKRELVSSRLGKRLRATGCETYSTYCALLSRPEGEAEINQLVDAISTNHTFFFPREKAFFVSRGNSPAGIPPQRRLSRGWVFPVLERGGIHWRGALLDRHHAGAP